MNLRKKIRLISINFLLITVFPWIAFAGIDLPWSTTYNCSDWTKFTESINCDGVQKAQNIAISGHYEEITGAANNPNGAGGKGQRHYVGDGTNSMSGGTSVFFNKPQPELWIRWYMRYKEGFKWNSLIYDKWIYLLHGNSPNFELSAIPEFEYNNTRIYAVKTGQSYRGGGGWTETMGGSVSDGKFHCYEVHVRVDTNGSNGIAEIWVDGKKEVSNSNASFGRHAGWTFMNIGHNQKAPSNGGFSYVDFDDVAISSTGYIGPLGGSSSASSSTNPPVNSSTTPPPPGKPWVVQ